MIYGDGVGHVATEEGILYLYEPDGQGEPRGAPSAGAGSCPARQNGLGSWTRPPEPAGEGRSRVGRHLASLAVRVRSEEVELTPRPALVDERGRGAHTDLSLTLIKSSAHCLRPSFELMGLASFRQIPSQALRGELG